MKQAMIHLAVLVVYLLAAMAMLCVGMLIYNRYPCSGAALAIGIILSAGWLGQVMLFIMYFTHQVDKPTDIKNQ